MSCFYEKITLICFIRPPYGRKKNTSLTAMSIR